MHWGEGSFGRVQVNSEQVSLESLAEAGERLCCPDIELIPPLRVPKQRRVETWQRLEEAFFFTEQ